MVAVALADGKLYWSEIGSGEPDDPSTVAEEGVESNIWRARLDGSEAETIVTAPNWVFTIALDPDSDKLYWAEGGLGLSTLNNEARIRRANLDGTAAEDVVLATSALSLDVADGRLYWAELSYGATKIRRANLDGTDLYDLVVSQMRNPLGGIALDVIERKMYWTEEAESCGSSIILRADLDGSAEEEVVTVENSAEYLEFDVVDRKLYWIERSWTREEFPDGEGFSCSEEDVVIRRANLNGSDVDEVTGISGYSNDFELDAVERKLYWVDYIESTYEESGNTYSQGGYVIRRASLDGTDQKTVVAADSGDYFESVAIDISKRKLYWLVGNEGNESIHRANMDGSGKELVMSVNTTSNRRNKLLAVSGSTGKMYYSFRFPGSEDSEPQSGIVQANLDGSGRRTIVEGEYFRFKQLALGVR